MFKYNLQSILKLREKIEDTKKRELGIANKNYENQLIKQTKLSETREGICGNIKDMSNIGIDINIDYIKQANSYMSVITTRLQEQEKVVNDAEQQVEAKRNELKECVKERKILENLKEIHFGEYLQQESRIEQRTIDEVITYRHGLIERE